MSTATAPVADAAAPNAAAGETVTTTDTAATATATAAATPARAKRGRGAAGMNVFGAADLAAATLDAKARGEKFTAFTVKVAGKPDRFYVSNHRNAIQHKVMSEDGYAIFSGDGTNAGGRKPADPVKRAVELIDDMDDATRQKLFAQYLAGGNAAAAAALPAAPARADTSPEFDSTPAAGNGEASSTPAATAPAATAPANAGKPGNGNGGGKPATSGGTSRKR